MEGQLTLKKPLFGKEIEITIIGKIKENEEKILKDSYKEAVRLEKIFNFYDKESMLSSLNKKRELEVNEEFLEVLKLAIEISKESKGLFDITKGKNYLQRKNHEKIKELNCSYNDVKISGKMVRLIAEDVSIDFGSIAKGYITDKVADFLKKGGIEKGIINSRGDILVWGNHDFHISIKHPRDSGEIASITLQNAGVATSGDYMQYSKDFSKSHILNQNDFASITVIAPSLTDADTYATLFSIISKEDILKILEKEKELRVLAISKDLNFFEHNIENIFLQKASSKIKELEIEDYFSKEDIIPKKEKINLAPHEDAKFEKESDSEKWFIGDGHLESNAREIFVRPGHFEDEDAISGAS